MDHIIDIKEPIRNHIIDKWGISMNNFYDSLRELLDLIKRITQILVLNSNFSISFNILKIMKPEMVYHVEYWKYNEKKYQNFKQKDVEIIVNDEKMVQLKIKKHTVIYVPVSAFLNAYFRAVEDVISAILYSVEPSLNSLIYIISSVEDIISRIDIKTVIPEYTVEELDMVISGAKTSIDELRYKRGMFYRFKSMFYNI